MKKNFHTLIMNDLDGSEHLLPVEVDKSCVDGVRVARQERGEVRIAALHHHVQTVGRLVHVTAKLSFKILSSWGGEAFSTFSSLK